MASLLCLFNNGHIRHKGYEGYLGWGIGNVGAGVMGHGARDR